MELVELTEVELSEVAGGYYDGPGLGVVFA